jgi:hypothetical protein
MTYFLIIGPWQIILILVAVFLGFLLTIIALIDVLKSQFNGNDKIVWLLVVLFTNFFGAILYFLIGRNQKIKTAR